MIKKPTKTCRLPFLFGAAMAVPLLSASVAGAQQTLYFGGFTGSFETTMKEKVIPPFEAEHDAVVEYVSGNSVDLLARLMAERDNQTIDVVILDDGPMEQALKLGLCGDIEPSAEYDALYPNARRWDGKAAGIGMLAAGLAYNKEAFEEKGWTAPTSWGALTDPLYKGEVLGVSLSSAFGLYSLVMTARLNGGGEENIDPGFEAILTRMKPNIVAWQSNSGQISALLQSGEATIVPWSSGRVRSLAAAGLPVEFVYPEEGAVELMEVTSPVTGSEPSELTQAFVRHLLTPEVQGLLAESEGYGPTNSEAVLPPELAAAVPYGPERIAQLVQLNWDAINERRPDWMARWAREVER
jgi:putative spermidine/putrescine transport system substrate-binding protein